MFNKGAEKANFSAIRCYATCSDFLILILICIGGQTAWRGHANIYKQTNAKNI